MGNHFGKLFRISTWGESHGQAIGVSIDGCPPNIQISTNEIQKELDRRRPGQSEIVTQRNEPDKVEIFSGIFEGRTIGSPICLMIRNTDTKSKDYSYIEKLYRPSHSDFTYHKKYGILNWQGGARSSARETIGRVAAGAIAKNILREKSQIEIIAYVKQVHEIIADINPESVTVEQIENNIVRCPNENVALKMIEHIKKIRKDGNSVGGIIECIAKNVPIGLGSPVFDKLEADLAKALMSLPASKGFEIGSGFGGIKLTGEEHNDPFYLKDNVIRTKTNNSGGIQGGISNGEPIITRVAFKPTSTIMKAQTTVDHEGNESTLQPKGRHDPCVLPRAVPIVEAMVALVLVDHYLRHIALTK